MRFPRTLFRVLTFHQRNVFVKSDRLKKTFLSVGCWYCIYIMILNVVKCALKPNVIEAFEMSRYS